MMHLTAYDGDAGLVLENRRFLAGVGVSVAVHLLLLLAYRHTGPSLSPAAPEAPASITVRIMPPAPPPPPPRAVPVTPVAPAAPQRSAGRSRPTPVIAVPAAPRQSEAPEAFSVQQPERAAEAPSPAPGETPQFDHGAARQTARQLASQTRLGREGWANAQFPDPPLETESKLGKAISKAKRRNCKDGVPGGVLAPLLLAMDKKDHGCKW